MRSSLAATSFHKERQAFVNKDVFEYAAVVTNAFTSINEDILNLAREAKPIEQNQ